MADKMKRTEEETVKKRKRRPDEDRPRKRREDEERPRKRRSDEDRPKKRRSDDEMAAKRRADGERPKKKKRPSGELKKYDTAVIEGIKTTKTKKKAKVTDSGKAVKSGKDVKTTKKSKKYDDDMLMLRDGDMAKTKGKKRNSHKKGKKGTDRENKVSRNIGLVLAGLQIVASVVFLLALFALGMLPTKYLAVIAAVLILLGAVSLVGQLKSKKKAIAGKIFSFFMAVVLFAGSFYIFKANSAVSEISGGSTKLDIIIVVVPIDDPAETIQDAADYNFGVQYAIKGDDIQQTVSAICGEVGNEIQTTEYTSVQEQATKLHEGEVDAIILNDAYSGMLEDEFGDFSSNVKLIYSHAITTSIEAITKEVKVEEEAFTVYISGIDVYGAIETNSRSDVNILAVVNPKSHQILLVTTPRDYYVAFPGITGGALDKLTHAGIYGVDVSMATLDELYDTETEFYARVNFTSLIKMVDALGGIEVYSEYAFTASDGSAVIEKGMNHLDGVGALAFARERYSLPDGDNQRGKNQQAVITAMIQKAVSPAILMGASELLETVSGNVDTNMTTEQIQDLIKSQLDDPQPWKIKSMAAEGTGDSQYCYSAPGVPLYVTQPNYDSVNQIADAIKAVENGETFDDSAVAQ